MFPCHLRLCREQSNTIWAFIVLSMLSTLLWLPQAQLALRHAPGAGAGWDLPFSPLAAAAMQPAHHGPGAMQPPQAAPLLGPPGLTASLQAWGQYLHNQRQPSAAGGQHGFAGEAAREVAPHARPHDRVAELSLFTYIMRCGRSLGPSATSTEDICVCSVVPHGKQISTQAESFTSALNWWQSPYMCRCAACDGMQCAACRWGAGQWVACHHQQVWQLSLLPAPGKLHKRFQLSM